MNSGNRLWHQAKRLIPGGNQLLSKKPEMFLPNQWPTYYTKAKGVEVWDLDHRHYRDMSIMGMGACILGYAHDVVDQRVKKAIDSGSMCTLNSFEEVELAEKLVSLHPWADQVRFSRTGGEACAIAIRIARAASQKDKIAFCGYHGWHDWYLSSNLANEKNLDEHLLAGLKPRGVPQGLKNSAFPFHYGSVEELKNIVSQYSDEIGVIIMEIQRDQKINIPFLKEVRDIATKMGVVLIFDEISSGFRAGSGGMHLQYDLKPDMVILGKALGNGYPISAIIGRKEVMQAAQYSFISSTFWTERVGFSAALAVLEQFEKHGVSNHLIEMGAYVRGHLQQILDSKGLNIKVLGMTSAPKISIQEENPQLIKTVYIQEMLKKGFLTSSLMYLSWAHTKEVLDQYLIAADETFGIIESSLESGALEQLLEGPVCHSGFKRIT